MARAASAIDHNHRRWRPTATMHPRVRLIPDAVRSAAAARDAARVPGRHRRSGSWRGWPWPPLSRRAGPSPSPLVVVVALVSAGSGVVIRMASIPRTIRAPHEAFAWLGAAEVRRFEDRTGSKAPFNAVAMRTWLDRHPSTPATVLARAELLGTLGDLPGARAELAAAPEIPADDLERVERATLTVWLGFLETGDADLGPLDTVAATTAPASPAGLAAAVSRALAETRAAARPRSARPAGAAHGRSPAPRAPRRRGWSFAVARAPWSRRCSCSAPASGR